MVVHRQTVRAGIGDFDSVAGDLRWDEYVVLAVAGDAIEGVGRELARSSKIWSRTTPEENSVRRSGSHLAFWVAFSILILFALNWVVTPEFVGVTKLESKYRPKMRFPFDAAQWKRTQPSSGERYKMVDTLLEKVIEIGDDFEKVERLLGSPEITEKRESGEVYAHYTLGSQSQFPAHSALFKWRLENSELWVLLLHFKQGKLWSFAVVPS